MDYANNRCVCGPFKLDCSGNCEGKFWFMFRLCIVGLAVLVSGVFDAEARTRWKTPGNYRFRLVGFEAFPLDQEATDLDDRLWGRHQLRLKPRIEMDSVTLRLELDVLTGQIFGDVYDMGADFLERRQSDPREQYDGWTTVRPRQAWLQFRSPRLDVRLGQLGGDGGLGRVESNGNQKEKRKRAWVHRFGDPWNGDLVDRILIGFRPFLNATHSELNRLVLAFGADYVFEDEHAHVLDGDSAVRFLSSLYYPGDEFYLGFLGMQRVQVDHDGEAFHRTTLDLYGSWTMPFFELGGELRIQGEGVFHLGRTERAHGEGVSESDILSMSGVLRAEYRSLCPHIAASLELGYASGDDQPEDNQQNGFTSDPDYRVGFVLFPDVLRLITLRGAERVAGRQATGGEDLGAETIPTDGGIRNTLYLNPAVSWRPGHWNLTAATLLAWSAVPFIDVERTVSLGRPSDHRGRPAGRYYGTELDFAVEYRREVSPNNEFGVGLEAGVLFPGDALACKTDDDPIGKLVWRTDIRW